MAINVRPTTKQHLPLVCVLRKNICVHTHNSLKSQKPAKMTVLDCLVLQLKIAKIETCSEVTTCST